MFSDKGLLFRQRTGPTGQRITLDGINVENYKGVIDIFAPYFVTKSPDRTILNLINANEDEDATVTIVLHGFDQQSTGHT